ncbi:hypothetical protein PM082_007934 [Marasmius tenuissimus]|nr:hypothetical protein PM082_007934 [Marasmius tenuissimus]
MKETRSTALIRQDHEICAFFYTFLLDIGKRAFAAGTAFPDFAEPMNSGYIAASSRLPNARQLQDLAP